jgi:hypothetical protein
MKEQNEEQIREFLKKAMHPVDQELNRELWPRIQGRLDARPVQVPWFDWVLLALVAIWCLLFPDAIPALLYHL